MNCVQALPESATDLTHVYGGPAVKAGPVDSGRVGGYLVVFGSVDRSEYKDYFDSHTDFGPYVKHPIPLMLDHGKSIEDDLGDLTVRATAGGLEVDGRLSLASPGARHLYGMLKAGKLRWSSGALSHRVKRERQPDSSNYVSRWHICEGSLTSNPADLNAVAHAIKAMIDRAEVDRLRAELEALAPHCRPFMRSRSWQVITWPERSNP